MALAPASSRASSDSQPVTLLATTELSSAQILALDTTAIAVTPEPAAGGAIYVQNVWAAFHYGTTPYTSDVKFEVNPHYRGYQIFVALSANFLTRSFDCVYFFDGATLYSDQTEFDGTDLAGEAWKIKADIVTTPTSGGDGTLTVYCTYVEFDV